MDGRRFTVEQAETLARITLEEVGDDTPAALAEAERRRKIVRECTGLNEGEQ